MNRLPDWRTTLPMARLALRCHARTRRGTSCQAPAIRGRRRCRLHGGLSTGAPCGTGNGMFQHGLRTVEAIEQRRATAALIREYRRNLAMLGAAGSVT
jgi:hypothetical protein